MAIGLAPICLTSRPALASWWARDHGPRTTANVGRGEADRLEGNVKAEAGGAAKGQGLRARGKFERRRRLTEAARKVFLARGYEAATTREIAALADVAIGTLFVYAPEKRDLLFLILNDDLDALLESATRGLSREQPLMKQLIRIFRPLYEYFEGNVEIGRYGLREIFLFQDEPKANLGPEAARVYDRISRFRSIIAETIEELSARGRLAKNVPGETIARALLWLHWGHTQSWLSQARPKADAGVGDLRRLFALVIGGLSPRNGEI
jgi:AcrR family transcriptional regulator